jgi:hypothetical protein
MEKAIVDNYVDMSTATPDQTFMLMLCERVEKLEEELSAIKKSMIPGPVAPCSKALHEKLADLYKSHIKKQECDDMKSLEERVPKNIFDKIPSWSAKHLLDSLSNDVKQKSYTAYYAMSYLERNHQIDEEFIEWYSKTLGL